MGNLNDIAPLEEIVFGITNLKPCPFCGSPVVMKKVPLWNNNGQGYKDAYEFNIHCENSKCNCNIKLGNNTTIYNSEEDAKNNAIKAWNKRYKERDEIELINFVSKR